eukprot:3956419-Ditylum_brightwellii.AAC.1
MPTKGIFKAEYSLIYILDKFKKKIEVHLDNTYTDHVKKLQDFLGNVYKEHQQSNGLQHWIHSQWLPKQMSLSKRS